MGLFTDLFTSDNEEEAARQKQAGLRAGQTAANTALDSGYNTASGLYDRASGYYDKAQGAFDNGMGYYEKALTPYADISSRGADAYGKFFGTYSDATGVNGAEGIGRAGDLYRSLPGYSAGREMGLNDLERRAAARGNLGGGNMSADTIKYARDYDSTKYKDFLSSLLPGISSGQSLLTGGAAGQAGVYGQQGNAAAQKAGMFGQQGNLSSRQGDLAANIGGQKAGYGYKTETGAGDANAEATMAKENSSANFWGALMGGANLLAKAGTGGLFGGIGSSFMGGGSPSGYGR